MRLRPKPAKGRKEVERRHPPSGSGLWRLRLVEGVGGCQIAGCGADTRNRTRNPLLTRQALYQLSYTGIESAALPIIARHRGNSNSGSWGNSTNRPPISRATDMPDA